MLITCDNETDIIISKSAKDKICNLEYTDLSLLLRHNLYCQSVSIISYHLQMINYYCISQISTSKVNRLIQSKFGQMPLLIMLML